jgi:membrane associated rhomboid family serine protease
MIIIVFLLQMIPGFTEALILNEKAVNGLQIWRFVSAVFLHGSVAHLILNLFAFVFFGFALERTIGSKRFLVVFFASGIIANIISINFYPASLGASGAVYGIIGCLTFIRPLMMVPSFGLLLPMFAASIVWIIGDLLRTFSIIDPGNVGSIAHISGIVVGFLAGIFYRGLRGKKVKVEKIEIPESMIEQWENTYMRGR